MSQMVNLGEHHLKYRDTAQSFSTNQLGQRLRKNVSLAVRLEFTGRTNFLTNRRDRLHVPSTYVDPSVVVVVRVQCAVIAVTRITVSTVYTAFEVVRDGCQSPLRVENSGVG